jgi:transposase-like protein
MIASHHECGKHAQPFHRPFQRSPAAPHGRPYVPNRRHTIGHVLKGETTGRQGTSVRPTVISRQARCSVPWCGGETIGLTAKETLWDRYSSGSATTTHAIRAGIQRSKASIQALSERHGINPKSVAKWRRRASPDDCRMGPKVPHSTVLLAEEELLIVAFRRHTESYRDCRRANDVSQATAACS